MVTEACLQLHTTTVCEKTIHDCELKIQKTLQQVKDKACLKEYERYTRISCHQMQFASLDDFIAADNPVRIIDVFVEKLEQADKLAQQPPMAEYFV